MLGRPAPGESGAATASKPSAKAELVEDEEFSQYKTPGGIEVFCRPIANDIDAAAGAVRTRNPLYSKENQSQKVERRTARPPERIAQLSRQGEQLSHIATPICKPSLTQRSKSITSPSPQSPSLLALRHGRRARDRGAAMMNSGADQWLAGLGGEDGQFKLL